MNPWLLLLGAPYWYFVDISSYSIEYNQTAVEPMHAHKYVYRLLDPGDYTFTFSISGKKRRYKELNLALAAGGIYYLKLDNRTRWFSGMPYPAMTLCTDTEGKNLLKKCSFSPVHDHPLLPHKVYRPLF